MTITEKFRKDYQPFPFDVNRIQLDFNFREDVCLVESVLEISRKAESDFSEPLVLNGEELSLESISLDGVILTPGAYRLSDKELRISDVPDDFVLRIKNTINPAQNTSLNGLYKSNKKYCSQCEAEGFRRITYFPDRPDVLSRYEVTISADKEKYPYLLSNGELIEQAELDNGRHMAKWADPFPKPSYLFALVAGDFDLLEDSYTTRSGTEVALQIYVDKGKLDQCDFAMESLKKSMRWDEQTYGLEYDLNRYMIVAVGDFNMGAMENKGLNVFNTAYVLANNKTATDSDFAGVEAVIGHEYFHNWTGNRVTCRDWFQLSLKEGLTVFREQQFSGDMNSESIQRIDDVKTLRAHQFPEDAGPMAHPIRPDSYIEMNNFYTHTVYIKGAEVIRMLQTILGKRQFNQGVRHYLEKHDGQAVTCEDFVVAMEEVSGIDLSKFRYWYSQAGTPEVTVEGIWLDDSQQFILEFEQSCPPTPGQSLKQPFFIPISLGLLDDDGNAMTLDVLSEGTDTSLQMNSLKDEVTLMLVKSHHRVTFQNVKKKPVPSLLRGFSAPVKLNYEYINSERIKLISHDKDSYVSWQANQDLVKQTFDAILADNNQSDSFIDHLADLLDSRRAIIADETIDPAFKALQLEIAPIGVLMETYQPIPIARLIDLWPEVYRAVAENLIDELLVAADQCESKLEDDSITAKEKALWRRLLVTIYSIAAATQRPEVFSRAEKLYQSQQSMTIKQGMLTIIHHNYTDQSGPMLDHFYDDWQDEELVLDKWFSIQSTLADDRVFEQIQELLNHADFTITNPNKVRALLFRFAMGNPTQFHHESGRGYDLICRYVIKLNRKNPQVAARLCSAFNGWRHLDCDNRKTMMQDALKRILAHDNLSADVFEIANKALA